MDWRIGISPLPWEYTLKITNIVKLFWAFKLKLNALRYILGHCTYLVVLDV